MKKSVHIKFDVDVEMIKASLYLILQKSFSDEDLDRLLFREQATELNFSELLNGTSEASAMVLGLSSLVIGINGERETNNSRKA